VQPSTLSNPPIHFVQPKGSSHRSAILLHGWGQNHRSLLGVAELLTGSLNPFVLDLPGFGTSPPPGLDHAGRAWGTLDYARRLVGFMDANNLRSTTVIGHSYGGRVAVQLAAHFPDRIDSIVLIDAAGLPPQRPPALRFGLYLIKLGARLLARTPNWLGGRLRGWYISKVASSDYQQASPELRPVLVNAVNENLALEAGRVGCPVLLIWGERDAVTPLEMGQRYQRLLKNSTLVVVPDGDHFPFLGKRADVCASHITRFVEKTNPSPSSRAIA